MARIDNLFDVGRGKLGNLVFYKMKGKGIVRTRPEHYSDRKSPAQLAQRQRLQVASTFLKPFSDLIRITFVPEAEGRTARSEALSHLMHKALAGDYPDIRIDRSRALLSRGPLSLPARAWVEARPDGLLIRWENSGEGEGINDLDTLVVMALSEDARFSDFKFTGAHRSAGEYIWKPALKFTEGTLPCVWIAFRNRQETLMSDSLYLGRE